MTPHAQETAGAFVTYSAAMVATLGGMSVNEWAAAVGIVLALVRLPVEIHRLWHYFRK